MRGRALVKGACFLLLSAGPLLVAIPSWGEEGATSVSDSRSSTYIATVLERKDGSLTLKRESGEVEILSLDDSGLSLHIDRDVVKGSRVQVSEEKSTNANSVRTLDIKLAPPSAK